MLLQLLYQIVDNVDYHLYLIICSSLFPTGKKDIVMDMERRFRTYNQEMRDSETTFKNGAVVSIIVYLGKKPLFQ